MFPKHAYRYLFMRSRETLETQEGMPKISSPCVQIMLYMPCRRAPRFLSLAVAITTPHEVMSKQQHPSRMTQTD